MRGNKYQQQNRVCKGAEHPLYLVVYFSIIIIEFKHLVYIPNVC